MVRPCLWYNTTNDLMVRGHDFYAYWDSDLQVWSTDQKQMLSIIDGMVAEVVKPLRESGQRVDAKYLCKSTSGESPNFKGWIRSLPDSYVELDSKIKFFGDKSSKTDYSSKHLPYALVDGPCPAYEELVSTLYDDNERRKFEWAIGSVIVGDSVNLQKFFVFYGDAGTGKSTILDIVSMLFEGYCTFFDAESLGTRGANFSMEPFRGNPLVAIQQDGDLSRIESNTRINSIVSHESMVMSEKYKSSYTIRPNALLFMGTNKPVKITDAKSGIIRRLIDIRPTGKKIPFNRYCELKKQLQFEIGAIASYCKRVYLSMGPDYYNSYRPLDMMFKTDVFYNFVEANLQTLSSGDGISLKQAYTIYKEYCDESLVEFKLPMYKFREELKNYFSKFSDYVYIDGKMVRSYFSGFLHDKFSVDRTYESDSRFSYSDVNVLPTWLILDKTESVLDEYAKEWPAQYASDTGIPQVKWKNCQVTLNSLDTSKLHYTKPENSKFICVDFDLKDENGKKSKDLNLEAASKWPPTYAEYSQGGSGVHLHYIYKGDVRCLSPIYEEGIEIKVFTGNSSLRRRLSYCNNLDVAEFPGKLPRKEKKNVLDFEGVKNEKAIRTIIIKNLEKGYHPATKPSVDFIFKTLEDAYNNGVKYDVTDMRPRVMAFAANSTNNAEYCLKLFNKMHFKSEEANDPVESEENCIVFFDVEVFPNLFIVNWKYDQVMPVRRMINPTPAQIEDLLKMKLVGFNNRRYDNHILYARYIGYDNQQLFELSQRLIAGSPNSTFSDAYNISYTDIYDFASAGNKKSLKKFEIELGLHHQELGLPWDKPVPEDQWISVAEYCDNDVISTEATFHHLKGDWLARQMLAKLSGLTENDTTNQHTTRIIFGKNKNPQLVYTDLSETFQGYKYDGGKNLYRGEDVGKGGFVWARPGIYGRTITFDVRSMHPSSIIALNMFGEYTARFKELVDARAAIKHKDYDTAKKMLDGALVPYLNSKEDADAVSDALKTAINSVYGLTSASFSNPFRDPRNVNNIVALRGALFMATLRDEVLARGGQPIHIKTDSIKVVNPTPDLVEFIMDFGLKYGYEFEVEHIFDRICLVNNVVYIAHLADDDPKKPNTWTATGAQFAHPYVFKTLFSNEKLEFADYCETKSVSSPANIYLDMNEGRSEDDHDYVFVGRVGLFCPVKEGTGGGLLMRGTPDENYGAVTGTKGYRWKEAEVVKDLGIAHEIDDSYQKHLAEESIETIDKFGDFEAFRDVLTAIPYNKADVSPDECPIASKYPNCSDCPKYENCEYIPF